jgi:NADH dehydrogenase/NADH:ubiquinone oxidoreductase subunit G
MVKLTIDNKAIEVENEVTTILEAAEKAHISIPTLCYHEDLTPIGSCRLCTVEVSHNGKSGIVTACNYPVADGMTVITNSEKVIGLRKMAMELLLAQCPQSEKIQQLARQLGVKQTRFAVKTQDCILCQRCFKACHEIVGAGAINFTTKCLNLGTDEASISIDTEKCIGCGSCTYVCPTDAITLTDAGTKRVLTLTSPKVQKLEFTLKQCKKCGFYWAPEKQLEFICKTTGQPLEIFDLCPDCRD